MDLLTAFGAGVVSTFVPLYVGVYAPRILKPHSERSITFFAAAALGVLFWFYLDVMLDSTLLGQNEGGTLRQAVLVAAFSLSLILLFGLEDILGRRFPSLTEPPQTISMLKGTTFVVAALVALGVGFHAVGEGDAIGHALPPAASIQDAIGGINGGTAYVLHKFLEGYVVGTVALLASSTSTKRLGILGAIAGIPTLIGFFLGISIAPDSSFFFALSGAGVLYGSYRLIAKLVTVDAKWVIVTASLLGFYAMYFAGTLHV